MNTNEDTLKHKNCPGYCHHCPDLGGRVMPFCYGTINNTDPYSLSGCHCRVEMECARNGAASLVEMHGRHLPDRLKLELVAFSNSPVPGRRSKVVLIAALDAGEEAK